MCRLSLPALCWWMALGFLPSGAAPALEGRIDSDLANVVRSAVDVGMKALSLEQGADGSWNGDLLTTALTAWALIEGDRSGTAVDDPHVRNGLGFVASSLLADEAGAELALGEVAAAALLLRRAADPAFRELTRWAEDLVAERLVRESEGFPGPMPAAWELGLAAQALGPTRVAEDCLELLRLKIDDAAGDDARSRLEAEATLEVALLCAAAAEDLEVSAKLPAYLEALATAWSQAGADTISNDRFYFLVHSLEARRGAQVLEGSRSTLLRPAELARRLLAAQQDDGLWPAADSSATADRLLASAWTILALEGLYDG